MCPKKTQHQPKWSPGVPKNSADPNSALNKYQTHKQISASDQLSWAFKPCIFISTATCDKCSCRKKIFLYSINNIWNLLYNKPSDASFNLRLKQIRFSSRAHVCVTHDEVWSRGHLQAIILRFISSRSAQQSFKSQYLLLRRHQTPF